ncbi:DUF3833 domain-containing protein, partial [Alphaproteobacteria bacterium]|nr:DUF3833 domain-containing protein [Alphaproteobacteria bacterium]
FLVFVLNGCSNMKLDDFAEKKPEFKLEEYFLGKTSASGLFIDRFGKVKRQFTVDMEGIQDGDLFVLNETFLYDNGEEEFRRWEITKTGEKTYQGSSSDIKGIALGERSGNAVNWHYTLKLKYKDGIMLVKFDDWLIMQDEKNVFNKATMKKFGVRLGDVYLFFKKD